MIDNKLTRLLEEFQLQKEEGSESLLGLFAMFER